MTRNLIYNYFGAAVLAGSQVVAIPFYVALLNEDGWGSISVVLSWTAALMVLEAGVTLSISRQFAMAWSGDPGATIAYLRKIESRYLVAAGLCALAGCASWMIAQWTSAESGSKSPLVPLVCFLAACQVFAAPYRGVLVGSGTQVPFNQLLALFAVTRHLLGLLAAYVTSDVPVVVLVMGAVTIAEGFARRRAASRAIEGLSQSTRPGTSGAAGKLRDGAAMLMVGSVVGAAVVQMDRLYLSGRTPLAEFGAYAIAVTISVSVLQLVHPLSQAMIPRLTEISGGAKSAVLARLQGVLLAAGALLVGGTWLFGRELLGFWLPSPELAELVYPLLVAHLTGTAINALSIPGHLQLLAQHRDSAIAGANAAALLCQLSVLAFGFDLMGTMTGAISWICANMIMLFAYSILVRKG